jgi:cyclopropane fatty-acyl-phospholipid synthase-like methyltransferase
MTTPAEPQPPPYFDALLARLSSGDPEVAAAFGRHVHWGYWADPDATVTSGADYAVAAEELCRRVCDAAPIRDGMRVLDVGCGFGGTIASLNERFRNLDMTGVNIDARQLARAAETVRPINANRTAWVEADACALPFEAGQFDAVLAVECAFHFPSRAKFLAEAARVLRRGGRLALSDFIPAPEGLASLRQYDNDDATRESYGRVNLLCSEGEYRALATAAGFTELRFEDITPHTMPTYAFLKSTAASWQFTGHLKAYRQATRRLEVASRVGWLRYTIVSATRGG